MDNFCLHSSGGGQQPVVPELITFYDMLLQERRCIIDCASEMYKFERENPKFVIILHWG